MDKELCEKYPEIFANRHGDMRQTAMCWGFECGEGWYPILDNACGLIKSYLDNNRQQLEMRARYEREAEKGQSCPEWLRHVVEIPPVVATQIKEKFGTLRFYFSGGDKYVDGIISMAEAMSAITCEACGQPGKLRHGGWVRTLCDAHAEEMGYE